MNLNGQEADLEVPLRSQIGEILQKYHDNVGHPGTSTTINSVQQRYTWKGIYNDIATYVSISSNLVYSPSENIISKRQFNFIVTYYRKYSSII